MQEAGVENLFTFGVDAQEVDQLRKDRKDFKDYDPRWKAAFKLLYDGKFGDKEYFKVRLSLSVLTSCKNCYASVFIKSKDLYQDYHTLELLSWPIF